MAKNYYEILNVKKTASYEEIKLAYRRLASKFHPDKFDGDKVFAGEMMKQINVAYNIISNPISRSTYDQWLEANEQPKVQPNENPDKDQVKPKKPNYSHKNNREEKRKSKPQSRQNSSNYKRRKTSTSKSTNKLRKGYKRESQPKFFGESMIKRIDELSYSDKWSLIWILVFIYFLIRISS